MRGEKERRPSDPSSVSVKHGNIFDLDASILTPPLSPPSLSINRGFKFLLACRLIANYFTQKCQKETLITIFEGGSHLLLLYFD